MFHSRLSLTLKSSLKNKPFSNVCKTKRLKQDCEKPPKKKCILPWDIDNSNCINEDCKPFPDGISKGSICETRRFRKCLKQHGTEDKCKNLAPQCLVAKVYPMLEATFKERLPGCPIVNNKK